jgi:hypothetical protein
MRFSPGRIGNAIAWMGLSGLILLAMAVANRLGFAGLVLLGLMAAFICTMAELDHDTSGSSSHVLRARLERPSSHVERQGLIAPLRFYKWCGIVLAVIGVAGFAWQQWTGSYG